MLLEPPDNLRVVILLGSLRYDRSDFETRDWFLSFVRPWTLDQVGAW